MPAVCVVSYGLKIVNLYSTYYRVASFFNGFLVQRRLQRLFVVATSLEQPLTGALTDPVCYIATC